MSITGKVLVSALLVAGVLWFMWRLPRRGQRLFGSAPPLALGSAWAGLIAAVVSALLWWLPHPDRWVTALFLFVDPAAVAAGVLVLWIYRGWRDGGETVSAQRIQARVGIALGLLAVALGYWFVMSRKDPFTPIGP